MGLDRRNWRKPYTEDELKSMISAGEMLQLRQRVAELEKERDSAYKIADHYRAERDELLKAMALAMPVMDAHAGPSRLADFYAAIASIKEKA